MNNNEEQKNNETIVSFTTDQLEEIREEARRKAKEAKHKWKQRGIWLVCSSCDHEHGFYLGPRKIMVGEKDGMPIIKEIDISSFSPRRKLKAKSVRSTPRKRVS